MLEATAGGPSIRSMTRRNQESLLSDAARRFLLDDVVTVERLNVLLFLYRHANRWWDAPALASELEMPVEAVHSHLEHLSARNLLDVRIAESVIYCYRPAREELAKHMEEVVRVHYYHRDVVAAVLSNRPGDAARLFANAFRLRRDKPDG